MLTSILLSLNMSVEDVLGNHKEKGKFRKDLQDVLQCSMSRRMPKRSPMLLLLPCMINLYVLERVGMELFNVTIATDVQ